MPQKLYRFVNFGGALIALVLASPANAVERKLLIGSFESIVVIGDIDVSVETGKPVSAKASGDRRVLDSLKLERSGTPVRPHDAGGLNRSAARGIRSARH